VQNSYVKLKIFPDTPIKNDSSKRIKNTEHGIKRKLGILKLAEKLGNVSQLIIDYVILNPAHGQKRVSDELMKKGILVPSS